MKRRILLSAALAAPLAVRASPTSEPAACGDREAPAGLPSGFIGEDAGTDVLPDGAPVRRTPVERSDPRVDVLVVGSGAAGLSAAIAARRSGAGRVVVIEKALIAGGHTLLSSGSFSAARTPAEVAGLMNEMLDAGRGASEPELVRVVAEGSWAARERLAALGVPWGTEPFRAVGSRSPRSWSTGSPQSGYDYMQALMSGVRAFGAAVRFGVRAERLIFGPAAGGRRSVAGVAASLRDGSMVRIPASSVILATGGYTASKALIRRWAPRIPLGMPTTANPAGDFRDTSTGDGILMAMEAGAKLRDMDALEIIPFSGGRLVDFVGAEIWLNAGGRRFISEGEDFLELRKVLDAQPGAVMWAVSDARSPKGATLGLKLMDGTVRKAETLEELARGMRMDPAVLRDTFERYNRSARQGWDEQFGRPMRASTLETPPFFYGREILSLHYSCGGVAIDTRARVLDERNRIIPGLFAAGETTGGVHGRTRVGGCGIVDACVFGDIAGREAALRASI